MSDLKIFAKTIEPEAQEQVRQMAESKAYRGCKIRIMPDCHAGKGCTVGTVIETRGKVVPNTVGVDIGCGMHVVDLGFADIDMPLLDRIINDNIPSGFNVHERPLASDMVDCMYREITERFPPWIRCFDLDYVMRSLGTLGGGNHFIEVDVDNIGRHYLVIHSGSRNLGVKICNFFQMLATKQFDNSAERERIIFELKAFGRQNEINDTLRQLKSIPKDLAYLSGPLLIDYFHSMRICQQYADLNRQLMAQTIVKGLGIKVSGDSFTTVAQLHRHLRRHNPQGSCERKEGRAVDYPSEHARRFAVVYWQGQRRLASVGTARCRSPDVALGSKEATQHGRIPSADARHLLHIGM